MKRRDALVTLALLPLARPLLVLAASDEVHVFRHPDCGCCTGWVRHLEAAGFSVQVTAVGDTAPVRARLGMPAAYASCHTATVGGYVVEGHVPAAEVRRLLQTRPTAIGLAVPGMPVGSPGMEMGGRVDAYEVILVGPAGDATVFARYPAQ